jgi:hypothetical protein
MHFRQEEEMLFPKLAEIVKRDVLLTMSYKIHKARINAPTRPHVPLLSFSLFVFALRHARRSHHHHIPLTHLNHQPNMPKRGVLGKWATRLAATMDSVADSLTTRVTAQ